MVLETLIYSQFSLLMQLMAREYFIKVRLYFDDVAVNFIPKTPGYTFGRATIYNWVLLIS